MIGIRNVGLFVIGILVIGKSVLQVQDHSGCYWFWTCYILKQTLCEMKAIINFYNGVCFMCWTNLNSDKILWEAASGKQCWFWTHRNCDHFGNQLEGWPWVGSKTQRWVFLGIYSLRGKASYRQISWSLEATRLGVIMIILLRNLTGILVALLLRCLSNFRAIGKL